MAYISEALRRKVAAAAGYCCSYCLTSQRVSGAQMHIDHCIPISRGGASDETNLSLACAWCNTFKGDQTHTVDPITGDTVPLFHPRAQRWSDHFTWSDDGVWIVGLTSTGRATVLALQMNNEWIVPARQLWVTAGWHPPQD